MGACCKKQLPFLFWGIEITIQHRDIPDAQLHEPKGAASASLNQAYFSSGAGSGVWKKVGSESLQGLTGDGGNNNRILVTNGANGFTQTVYRSYGSNTITNNTNAFAVTAAVDPTLATNSDYILLTGTGAPWAPSGLEFGGVAVTTDRITVPVTGVYKVNLWSTISGYPNNAAKIAVKYRVSGGAFSSRRPISKSNSAGDAGQLGGFGFAPLSAGDFVQMYIASTHTGGLIFTDLNVTLELVRQTA